jgi:hypothetical protein
MSVLCINQTIVSEDSDRCYLHVRCNHLSSIPPTHQWIVIGGRNARRPRENPKQVPPCKSE